MKIRRRNKKLRCVNKKLNLNQLSSIRIAKEDVDEQFYIWFGITDQIDGDRIRQVEAGCVMWWEVLPLLVIFFLVPGT
jgi:hypothetical protein